MGIIIIIIIIIYKNYTRNSVQKKQHIIRDDTRLLFIENFVMEKLRKEDFCRSRGRQALKNFQTFVKTDVYLRN